MTAVRLLTTSHSVSRPSRPLFGWRDTVHVAVRSSSHADIKVDSEVLGYTWACLKTMAVMLQSESEKYLRYILKKISRLAEVHCSYSTHYWKAILRQERFISCNVKTSLKFHFSEPCEQTALQNSIKNQRDALFSMYLFYNLFANSTCFERLFRSSSNHANEPGHVCTVCTELQIQ